MQRSPSEYRDDLCVLHHGDARVVVPTVPPADAVVTDPPYGAGLCAGDESPEHAAKLLAEVLRLTSALMRPGSHVVFFWGSIGLDLAIEAGKSAGLEYKRLLGMHISQGDARPYLGWLQRLQPIVVMRVPGREIPAWRNAVAKTIFDAAKARGLSCTKLAKSLGCSERLVTKWWTVEDSAWSYPNDEHRPQLAHILGIDIPPPVESQDDMPCRHDVYEVRGGKSESPHPCEKPLWVIEDIVCRVAPAGGTVLDPFAGSGTTLVAARKCGRRSIGIEIDETACRQAVTRLRQQILF